MVSLAAFLAAGFAFEARACGEGARRAGDRRRLVAGIGGHWRALAGIGGHWWALVGAVAAGISARFADALFDMHVGLGALHSSGVRVLLADEPTSRRADEPTSRRADEPTSRRADEPTSRRADEPTSRRADEPTSRRADEPTSRRADEPTSRRADEPMSRHADGSTVPSVYESIPVSPMQSRRLADSPIYRFASACRAAVPRPSGAERSIIGSRIHTTPTRRPPAVARPFEAARRRRHIRRASRPTAVHSLEAHRRRKP
ncbi:SR protein factor [Burkholderia pseudomallei]|uniref:SR protein factor n=1 Tax=Burkholderia pseudomallei TaxID=28450 RepID=UPI004063F8DB